MLKMCSSSRHPYLGITVPNKKYLLKKIFGGSQILTINATKFAGLDEGATPLGPYSATRGFTW